MAFIYVTEAAKQAAAHYGISRALEKMVDNYGQRPVEEVLQLLEARYPYRYDHLTTAAGKFALVVKPVVVEAPQPVTAICILTLFKCGDDAWEDFKNSSTDERKTKLDSLLDMVDLNQAVADAVAQQKVTQERQKDPLPDSVAAWIEPLEDWAEGELLMESQTWADCFAQDEYARYWQTYYQLVSDFVQNPGLGQPLVRNGKIRRLSDSNTGRSVYGAHFQARIETGSDTVVPVCFLIVPYDPALTDKNTLEATLLRDFAWIQQSDGVLSSDDIARHARRSYPQYLLASEDAWYTLECGNRAGHDSEANLALSVEEATLLRRVRQSQAGEAVLPLFINGRAGSGKSTMLYHLFADYVYRRMVHDPLDGDILFLTYTRRLRDQAQGAIAQLLSSRFDFLSRESADRAKARGALPEIEKSLWTFGQFVQAHLPQECRARYRDDRRLDYRLFSQLYVGQDLPPSLAPFGFKGHRRVSPALSWHAIRAFIKGYWPDHYLTPDEYEEIPRKERSLSPSDFRIVHGQVWEPWCKSLVEEYGFWDVQQMAADLLRNGDVSPQYAVVFCDEAQDFTRTELSYILNLLIYRRYDLGWRRHIRMPLAFAGDPFQTVNPTGFRWETLKTSFYNEVLVELDPLGKGTIGFDYQELTQNYRSQPHIVQLSNLIQLWREILLGFDVLPQKSWSDSDAADMPMLFTLGNSISEAELLDVVQRTSVVIVPCEQDQEDEFVTNDDVLRSLRRQYDALTVLSPMSAKGLEFPSVMIYKFGEYCPDCLMNPGTPHDLSDQYFLNKLYVAVTRAERDLVIVDTPRGENKLWRHALGTEAVEGWIAQSRHPDRWKTVSGVEPGNLMLLHWRQQDPGMLADSLRKTGEAETNPRLLRQAKPHYRRAGRDDLADLCEAEALEIERQFDRAGEVFLSLERFSDAERCFWRGMHWKSLHDLGAVHRDINQRYLITAKFMLSKSLDDAVAFLKFHLDRFKGGTSVPVSEPQFQEAIKEAIGKIGHGLDKEVEPDALAIAADTLLYLSPVYQIIGWDTVAHIYYAASQYGTAVRIWDSQPGGRPHIRAYAIAKARTTPWPENVRWWVEAGETQTIIEEYESHGAAGVPSEILEAIAGAYRKSGRAREAVQIYLDIGKLESVVEEIEREIPDESAGIAQPISPLVVREVYQRLLKTGQFERARRLLNRLASRWSEPTLADYATEMISELVSAQDWDMAMAVTIPEGLKIQEVQRRPLAGLSPNRQVELRMRFIERLAYSQELPKAHTKDKQKLSAYLDHIARDPERAWKRYLSLPKLSGAIEKVWRDIDILQYYEELEEKATLSPSERSFVHQRWLKVKARQIERLAGQTQSGTDGMSRMRSRRHELAEKAQQWAITLDEIDALPEYPDPETKVYADASQYKVEWRAPKCRITHKSTEGQITVDVVTGGVMTFGAPDPVISEKTADMLEISLAAWSLRGVLLRGKSLEFTLDNEHFFFELEPAAEQAGTREMRKR